MFMDETVWYLELVSKHSCVYVHVCKEMLYKSNKIVHELIIVDYFCLILNFLKTEWTLLCLVSLLNAMNVNFISDVFSLCSFSCSTPAYKYMIVSLLILLLILIWVVPSFWLWQMRVQHFERSVHSAGLSRIAG